MREWLRIRSLAQGHPTLEWGDFPQTLLAPCRFPCTTNFLLQQDEIQPYRRQPCVLLIWPVTSWQEHCPPLSSSLCFEVLCPLAEVVASPRGPADSGSSGSFQNLRISRCCLLTSQCLHSKSTVTLTSLLFCSSFSLSRNAQKLSCTISATWLIRDPPGPGVNSHQAATLERLGSHTLPPWIVAMMANQPRRGREKRKCRC